VECERGVSVSVNVVCVRWLSGVWCECVRWLRGVV
jgi:hypothetical protein